MAENCDKEPKKHDGGKNKMYCKSDLHVVFTEVNYVCNYSLTCICFHITLENVL